MSEIVEVFNIMRNIPLMFVGILFLLISLLPNCAATNDLKQFKGSKSIIYECSEYKAPKGDELQINVEIVEPDNMKVTVTNISDRDVFMLYMPGINSKTAIFTYLGMHKLNKESGEFEIAERSTFGSDLYKLPVGDFFEYYYYRDKDETYRFTPWYLIDEKLAEQFRNALRAEGDEKYIENIKEVGLNVDKCNKKITSEIIYPD